MYVHHLISVDQVLNEVADDIEEALQHYADSGSFPVKNGGQIAAMLATVNVTTDLHAFVGSKTEEQASYGDSTALFFDLHISSRRRRIR